MQTQIPRNTATVLYVRPPPTKHRHSYNFQTINLSPCVLFHSTCESGSEALWLDCRSADLPDKCLFHRLHNNKSIRRRSGWAIRRYKNHITDSRSNGRLIRNDPKDQHLRLLPTLCPQNRAGLHWGTPVAKGEWHLSYLLPSNAVPTLLGSHLSIDPTYNCLLGPAIGEGPIYKRFCWVQFRLYGRPWNCWWADRAQPGMVKFILLYGRDRGPRVALLDVDCHW